MTKLRFCLVVLTVVVLTISALAQVQNGQFTGVVTDPSGAAISNARVTVTNTGTNFTVTSTTGESGLYTAKELPVGNYKIVAEANGFKTSTNSDLTVNAGTIQRVDFKMQVGQTREVVEVSGEVSAVNTEDSKLASTVTAQQVENLPLNGRNIYDLIQMAPGAVNVRGVLSELGANTVVNGLREDFNGFMINGSSNKGLSGGAVNQPIEDTVQEFQELTLSMSAQYGNSAAAQTNVITKSGTNTIHGTGWWFNRNDAFDANNYFANQQGTARQALRFNQFGGTLGGALIKDKLFYFLSYQDSRFRESAPPTTVTVESPEFRQAVIAALPNSAAALLYKNFLPTVPGTAAGTDLDTYVGGHEANYLCPEKTTPLISQRMGALIGVTAGDIAAMSAPTFMGVDPVTGPKGPCPSIPGLQSGTLPRTGVNIVDNTIAISGSQNQNNTGTGNLYNGREASGRIDYNFSSKDRLFSQFAWNRLPDAFGFPNANNSNGRGSGFLNPVVLRTPNGQISWVHTFSPAVLNELKGGYTLNVSPDVTSALPGVPDIRFDDGSMGFGSYSGYPQTFHENIYSYSDMVSITHGKHNFKIGADFRRNLENSEFSVARPSYYFTDYLFFAADSPYTMSAGVDPGILTNQPGHLASNVRHWRNFESGSFFQDDWKATRRLTINLGVRYDLYTRHTELNNQVTTFIKGPGTSYIDNITTGAGQIKDASVPCTDPQAQLAGVCGPGGFTTAKSLGKGDHNNFGPSVGFAWDVFGDSKTSLRGGFGVAYEGTLYNPLSNSRWNLPYYSFNAATNSLQGDVNTVIYGPYTCNPTCAPDTTATPSYTGPATNPNQGTGSQATGNFTGWDPANPNLATLTGIVFPEGIRDPYVYNYYLGIQREIMPKLVFEANFVGTTGHKIFRAQNVNRIPGERLPEGTCVTDNIGRRLCSQIDTVDTPGNAVGRLNPNFGTLRVWANEVNSNYNSLQMSLKKQTSHGMTFNLNYTWSHAIDDGSTWHSGATSSNGAGGGDGYTTDVTLPGLDRGNSIYDIRHRLVGNYVYDLPFYTTQEGVIGHILGGWRWNGIVSWQTGAHWEPWTFTNGGDPSGTIANGAGGTCSQANIDAGDCFNSGGDFNLDGVRNDRPNAAVNHYTPSHDQWANGWGNQFTFDGSQTGGFFTAPCLGCNGNLGRNTFVGPSYVSWETSLFKNVKITERVNMQFRAEAFNVLNHTNFQLPGSGGATNMRTNSPTFGQAGGTFNPRNLQFGLKLSF